MRPGPVLPWRNNFFARRWRAEVPLRRLFWLDMLAVGSVLNLLATFGALMLLAAHAPAGLAMALHFAPLPYNVFLFAALWRHPSRGPVVVAVAALWLAVMSLL